MNDIPPLAYLCIGVVGLVTVLMFAGLFALMRARPDFSQLKMPKGPSARDANKVIETVRDPFGEERRQLNELSHLVEGLKERHDEGKGQPDP